MNERKTKCAGSLTWSLEFTFAGIKFAFLGCAVRRAPAPFPPHSTMAQLKETLADMIGATFPDVEFAFGYGSGVFPQKGGGAQVLSAIKSSAPMVDMVFAVKDPEAWHSQNLKMNPQHYALLPRVLGAGAITTVQQWSAGLYYNTLVPVPSPYRLGEGQLMKYGVVCKKALLKDLNEWDTLYCSGRLQKPVSILKSSASMAKPLESNLQGALAASVFLLPPNFSELDLYLQITSLSYEGDFRMGIAENPNKIENIVRGNNSLPRFQSLYRPFLDSLVRDKILLVNIDTGDNRTFQRTGENNAIASLRKRLPAPLHEKVTRAEAAHAPATESPEPTDRIQETTIIKKHLREIISRYSRTQTVKGIFTAGVTKSAIYSFQKILKRFK